MASKETLFSSLAFDCLELICRRLGGDADVLFISGDRLLLSKLRLLRSLKVVLGRHGGYETYSKLYGVLYHVPTLQSLKVRSLYLQQLKIIPLKPQNLPTSLTALKLSCVDAVVDFVANDALYQALPNLTSLRLCQRPGRKTATRCFLSLAKIPSSLRYLELSGVSSFASISPCEFKHLPTLIEEFTSDAVVEEEEEEKPFALRAFNEFASLFGLTPTPIVNNNHRAIRINNEFYRHQMKLNRFTSLYTLRLNVGPSTCIFAHDYPSTITNLDITSHSGGFLMKKGTKWNDLFPALQRLRLDSSMTLSWAELMEMPISMRFLTACLQDWKDLTREEASLIHDSLASRNHAYDSRCSSSTSPTSRPSLILPSSSSPSSQQLMVPSQMILFKIGAPLPSLIFPLFSGLVNDGFQLEIAGEVEEDCNDDELRDNLSARLDNEQSEALHRLLSSPNTRAFSFADSSVHCVVDLAYEDAEKQRKREIGSSLLDFSWHVLNQPLTAYHLQHHLPPQLRYNLRYLSCILEKKVIEGMIASPKENLPSSLFPNLECFRLFSHPSYRMDPDSYQGGYYSSTLSTIVPPTMCHHLEVEGPFFLDSPLLLPHLNSFQCDFPLDITSVRNLPATLRKLSLKLASPIDITNDSHRNALLHGFPRDLMLLILCRGSGFFDIIDEVPTVFQQKDVVEWEKMGFVFSKTSFFAPMKQRHADECTALKLLTRNLHLIGLSVPLLTCSNNDRSGPLLPRAPIQLWMRCSIPFYGLWQYKDPDPLELSLKETTDLSSLRQTVDALAPAKLSILEANTGDAYRHQDTLTRMYHEATGAMVGDQESPNYEQRKLSRAASLHLYWFAATMFHLLSLIFYGLRVYHGQSTLIGRLWRGEKHFISFTESFFPSTAWDEEPAHNGLKDLFRDLLMISCFLNLILDIVRLKQHFFTKWSKASIIPPHRRWVALLLLLCCFLVSCYFYELYLLEMITEVCIALALENLSTPHLPHSRLASALWPEETSSL